MDSCNLLVDLQSLREGRGRPRRDYPSRSEDKPYHGRGNNRPSRHLWVGNLPHNLAESDVAHYFLHFGELESVAFQPGRSYAFINYINEEDAFAAIKELQGFVIEGNPLKIEFAMKAVSFVHLILTFLWYCVDAFYFVHIYCFPVLLNLWSFKLGGLLYRRRSHHTHMEIQYIA